MSPVEERLHDALDSLHSRDDFVRFLELLVESFGEPGSPWQNASMESSLVALARATTDLEKFYDSPGEGARNVASPSWEAVAGLLFTARCADITLPEDR
jgi:hypothetical protein